MGAMFQSAALPRLCRRVESNRTSVILPRVMLILNGTSSSFGKTTARFPLRRPYSIETSSVSSVPPKFDAETDFLIVGSGAAGLTAALRARSLGLEPLIIEKGLKIGGASAYSGGGCWLPGNPVAQSHGIHEDRASVLKYMEKGIYSFEDPGPASSHERRVNFLENAPKVAGFLQDLGLKWHLTRGYPDYLDLPGAAKSGGRTLESELFDMKKLGDWEELVLTRGINVPPIHVDEAARLSRALSSFSDLAHAGKVMLPRILRMMSGQRLVGLGQALVGQLLYLNKQHGQQIWRNTPLVSLIQDANGSIIGARVRRDGTDKAIRAKAGVLLCAGGFARNKEMREKYGRQPASSDWTSVPPGDHGDAIWEGVKIGAATALLHEAWWGPTITDPGSGGYLFAVAERSRPFSIIVDSSGQRYMNEAASYTETGRAMYERHKNVPAVPSWLVVDRKYLNKYMLGSLMPRMGGRLKRAEAAGRIFSGRTIEELADKININSSQLNKTVDRWNEMSARGIDEDFGRGSFAYDRFFADKRVKPNGNMGPIQKAPFYAVRVVPGDLGTKGGLVTDENSRVLRQDGSVIEGVYACGNTTASIMGSTYLGAGSTLGPALTFAYIASNHAAKAHE